MSILMDLGFKFFKSYKHTTVWCRINVGVFFIKWSDSDTKHKAKFNNINLMKNPQKIINREVIHYQRRGKYVLEAPPPLFRKKGWRRRKNFGVPLFKNLLISLISKNT